jgi:hypothetical protein
MSHMARELSEGVLPAAAFRYRQVLKWASIISSVSILIAFWVWLPKDESRLVLLLVLLPVLLPYTFIPLRLYSQRLRGGLTLAIAMGCALFVPGIYLIRFAFTWDRRWWVLGNLILALLMQSVLIVTAVKTYLSMPRLKCGRMEQLGSSAYGFLLFALFWLFYSPVPAYITANEHSALRYLEASAIAAFVDAHKHGGLYAEAFGSLGPYSNPKCTATPHVMDVGSPTGYLFEYRGIQPSSTVQGCTWFKGFTMTARPIVYGKTGIRSFCVDGSTYVHFTPDNRPAKASDPMDEILVKEHRP